MDEYQKELNEKVFARLEELGYRKVKSAFVKGLYESPGSPTYERVASWLNDKRIARNSRKAWIPIITAIIAAIVAILVNIKEILAGIRYLLNK